METQQVSEYERLRLENIQRNEEYLQQLGFTESKSKRTLRSNVEEKVDSKKKRNKVNAIIEIPSRRSSRVAQLPHISYIESSIPLHNHNNGRMVKNEDPTNELIDGDLIVGTMIGIKDNDEDKKPVDLKPQVLPHSNSDSRCADLCADLGYFLGDVHVSNNVLKDETLRPHRLCEPVESYGKAAVMALANKGQLPRFSKYSGALEWANCLFLWVNLGGASGYANAFSEGGRYMMWFGGSRMHKDSPIVKRLIKAAAAKSTSACSEPVLLFVRREGEAYCCLGRVRWAAADLLSSPVQFKWELIDLPLFEGTSHFKLLREAS